MGKALEPLCSPRVQHPGWVASRYGLSRERLEQFRVVGAREFVSLSEPAGVGPHSAAETELEELVAARQGPVEDRATRARMDRWLAGLARERLGAMMAAILVMCRGLDGAVDRAADPRLGGLANDLIRHGPLALLLVGNEGPEGDG